MDTVNLPIRLSRRVELGLGCQGSSPERVILSANRSQTCLCIHGWMNIIEYAEDVSHVFWVSWDFSDTTTT